MNISPEEAQESLVAIAQTTSKTRKAYGYSGYYLMVWGLVWFFGFLVSQFLQNITLVGWIWGGLLLIGWVSSTVLGINQDRQVRSAIGPRIGFFFMALMGFTLLWFIILQPDSVRQGVMFVITVVMFGGVVAGILSRSVSTIIGSLTVTGLAFIGYYLLPSYFYLWEAIFGGLLMIGIGLALRLRWR